MKQYLLFAGMKYEPQGGWKDFKGSYNTVDEAKDILLEINTEWHWYQIVDSTDGHTEASKE